MARFTTTRRVLTGLVGTAVCSAVLLPVSAEAVIPIEPATFVVVSTEANASSTATASESVVAAGGSVWETHEEIGVIIARSIDVNFAEELRGMPGVELVGESKEAVAPANIDATVGEMVSAPPPTSSGPDPLEFAQWDMQMIRADEAHLVTDGSSDVVVGVLDSGIDASHPDLQGQVDPSLSVSCVNGGRPDTRPEAWAPTAYSHGTHVAGTIAAARNGLGIVGVAPGVRLASVKVVDDSRLVYPEYVLCGLLWSALHQFTLTNNSYYVDPWLYACPTSIDQIAISVAIQRAMQFVEWFGVLSVASAGNFGHDLANKTIDPVSPTDKPRPPSPRSVNNNCKTLPAEAPNVVAVSAVGALGLKSLYSNYGSGIVKVTAPGGDMLQSPGPGFPSGVVSTVPGGYQQMFGTSMAAPHVTGTLALLASQHPSASPATLRSMLFADAEPMGCPATYDPDDDGVSDGVCTTTSGLTGFYGYGMVDALRAVS